MLREFLNGVNGPTLAVGPFCFIYGKLAADEVGRGAPVGITHVSQRSKLERIVRARSQIGDGCLPGTGQRDRRPCRRRHTIHFDAVTHVVGDDLRKVFGLDDDGSGDRTTSSQCRRRRPHYRCFSKLRQAISERAES